MKELLAIYEKHRRSFEIAFGVFLLFVSFVLYAIARRGNSEFLFCMAGVFVKASVDQFLEG